MLVFAVVATAEVCRQKQTTIWMRPMGLDPILPWFRSCDAVPFCIQDTKWIYRSWSPRWSNKSDIGGIKTFPGQTVIQQVPRGIFLSPHLEGMPDDG